MVGTEVGGYRIEAKIGEGGMGTVYRAIETNLERRVAVKILNADLAHNAAIAERFRSEARAQANLNHTNIAVLYSFVMHDNRAMMVMEYVEGETFQQIIERRGLIPSNEAIPWFKQALLGVGAAHRMGVIHRDIKPSNLMLNSHGIVKVMDFGIAKVIGERGLTRTGSQVGTVYYMSPEQIKGERVDVRSDIYSLGVTLYEMLTAHVPFGSNTDFRVLTDHVQTPPPLPTTFYPYIPKGVENIVLKSLEKHPDDRFQHVEEFGSALEHPELWESYIPKFAVVPGAPAALGVTPVPYNPSAPTYAGAGQTYHGATPAPASPPPPTQLYSPPTGAGLPAVNTPAPIGAPPPPPRNFPTKLVAGLGALLLVALAALGFILMRPKPVPPEPKPISGTSSGGTAIASNPKASDDMHPLTPGNTGASDDTGGQAPGSAAPASSSQSSATTAHAAKAVVPKPVPAPAPAPESSPAPTPTPAPAPVTPEPVEANLLIPSGTAIGVRTLGKIDAAIATKGQSFRASIDAPVVIDGKVAIPRGATAFIRLISESKGGHFRGAPKVEFELASVTVHGKTYLANTTSDEVTAAGRGKRTGKFAAIGGAVGAVVGGITHGGKGAVEGAAAGGGAGAGAAGLTGDRGMTVPSEYQLSFNLNQPLTVSR
ncbi:MAG TPA: serine/threonine-protein kinase [Bryobacteraceae bacterium]|nr:serine/threonine-protein kinase [Bryobacteraceae bacterium]